jgi:hypothetical protein
MCYWKLVTILINQQGVIVHTKAGSILLSKINGSRVLPTSVEHGMGIIHDSHFPVRPRSFRPIPAGIGAETRRAGRDRTPYGLILILSKNAFG